MPRFTISRHTDSAEGDHYDLMLEHGDALRTWRVLNTAFGTPQPAKQVQEHRKLYLDYEGEISGGRGRVKIFDTGSFGVDEWQEDRIQVALVGRLIRTRLLFTPASKHPEDPDPRWIVVDPSSELRKGAAALLREAVLDEAPSPELEGLRSSLAKEEQKVMSFVDRYTHGGSLDWSHVELDPEIRRRLDSEGARWKHPWIAAAQSYARRLSDLAEQVRKSRPAPTA